MGWLQDLRSMMPVNLAGHSPPLVLADGCTFRFQLKETTPFTVVHAKWGQEWIIVISEVDREIAKLVPYQLGSTIGSFVVKVPPDEASYKVPEHILYEVITDGGGPIGYLYDGKVWPFGHPAPGLFNVGHKPGLGYGPPASTDPWDLQGWSVWDPSSFDLAFKKAFDPSKDEIPGYVILDSLPKAKPDLR